MAAGASASPYQVRPSGDPLTDGWRLFYSDASGKPISPFHDIPLKTAEGHYHFVCEIPRGLNAKLEINKNEPLNPIKQDIKRGALRFVHDVHPYRGYIWNYGAFPQTWEDPTHKDESTGCYGDNDPLDVCEIGSETASIGQIKVVKILGVIALIDEGETDWKVISIDVNDPLAEKLNDISDVETHLPGFTMATYEWFRTYKIPAGSPANSFALEGAAMNKEFAIKVIEENHLFWKNLHSGATPASGIKSGNGEKYEVSLTNTTLGNAHTPAEAPVLPNLGDHGLPVSKHTGSGSAPDGSVLTEVESLQQRRPHATASLSAVLADVADAIATGDLAKLTGSQNVKSLHVPGSPTKAVSEGNKIWPYSVAISTDQLASGPISFGVYQQTSPHGLPHAKSLPKGDHADFAELVAAGYVSKSGHLVIHSGAGKLVFANSNGRFVAVDASTADLSHSVESSCALAAQAPLGLIAAL